MRAPCVVPPPKVSTPPSRAGQFGYDRDHGEHAGRSLGRCARPASIAPARTKENELKTQAEGGFPVTFECYGVEVTTPTTFLCNGPPGGP